MQYYANTSAGDELDASLSRDQMEWLIAATRLPGKAPTSVAIHILTLAIEKGYPAGLEITPGVLAYGGLERSTVYRAMNKLEKAGLIEVERIHGLSPTVRIIDMADMPSSPGALANSKGTQNAPS